MSNPSLFPDPIDPRPVGRTRITFHGLEGGARRGPQHYPAVARDGSRVNPTGNMARLGLVRFLTHRRVIPKMGDEFGRGYRDPGARILLDYLQQAVPDETHTPGLFTGAAVDRTPELVDLLNAGCTYVRPRDLC